MKEPRLLGDHREACVYVSAKLDDFGLDPYAIRIYIRIVRRAGKDGCFESIENMAEACKISRRQVFNAIKTLLKHRLVVKDPKPGKPSTYFLTASDEWIPLDDPCTTCTPPVHHVHTHPCTTCTPPVHHVHTPINKELSNQRSNQQQVTARGGGSILQRNFWDDGPWGQLARELDEPAETVGRAFTGYLEALYAAKGKKDPVAYTGKVTSELFNTPGKEVTSTEWRAFERHYRLKRSAPEVKQPQNRLEDPVKLPDLPVDSEAEQARSLLKNRRNGGTSAREVNHDS